MAIDKEDELTTREWALKVLEEARAKVRLDAKEAQQKRKTAKEMEEKKDMKPPKQVADDKKKKKEAEKKAREQQKEAEKKAEKEKRSKEKEAKEAEKKGAAKKTPAVKVKKKDVYSGKVRVIITSEPDVARLNGLGEYLRSSPAISIIGSGGLGRDFQYYLGLDGEIRLIEFLKGYDHVSTVTKKNEDIILTFTPLL